MDDAERKVRLENLERLRQTAEKAYDEMYEAHSYRDANDFYREAKECYYDAIALAQQLELNDEAEKMSERLLHIKAVYRSQFFQ